MTFPAAVYQARQAKVFARMEERGLDLLFLPPSGDLDYLTGFHRRTAGNTDLVQPADWLLGAFLIAGRGVIVLSPYMASKYVRSQVAGKPWLADVVDIPEFQDPLEFLTGLPRRLGIDGVMGIGAERPSTLAVGNRLWIETAQGFQQAYPRLRIATVGDLVAALRMVKEPAELDLMRTAARIADEAFDAVVGRMKRGMTALDVATEVDLPWKMECTSPLTSVPSMRDTALTSAVPSSAGNPPPRSNASTRWSWQRSGPAWKLCAAVPPPVPMPTPPPVGHWRGQATPTSSGTAWATVSAATSMNRPSSRNPRRAPCSPA